MSRSLNKVVLIGNVGSDPEIRTTSTGTRVATVSLATTRRWTAADGVDHEKTEWHRIILWEPLVERIERRVRKGDRLFVEGRVEYRSWDDPRGRTRYATEIVAEDVVLLDAGTPVDHRAQAEEWRTVGHDASAPDAGTARGGRNASARSRWGDDELPF